MKHIVRLMLLLCLAALLPACSGGNSGQQTEKIKNEQTDLDESVQKEQVEQDVQSGPQTQENAEGSYDRLLYMGQASMRIVTTESRVIYIDPYAGEAYDLAADLILVTHSHYDHNGVEKVANRNPDCRIITWEEALEGGEHQVFDLGFAAVEAVEAGYNRWHDVNECVGYVVTLPTGVSVYVTGDTSTTEQMSELSEKQIDYAFYCCDGIFNMALDEAARCAEMVGAKHNIPYHVLAQDGVYFDRERAEQFDVEKRLIIEEGEEIRLFRD